MLQLHPWVVCVVTLLPSSRDRSRGVHVRERLVFFLRLSLEVQPFLPIAPFFRGSKRDFSSASSSILQSCEMVWLDNLKHECVKSANTRALHANPQHLQFLYVTSEVYQALLDVPLRGRLLITNSQVELVALVRSGYLQNQHHESVQCTELTRGPGPTAEESPDNPHTKSAEQNRQQHQPKRTEFNKIST